MQIVAEQRAKERTEGDQQLRGLFVGLELRFDLGELRQPRVGQLDVAAQLGRQHHVVLAELQAECMRNGLVLGHAEMVRKWVPM